MPKVGIVDYGMGNLRSVQKGLQKVGAEAELCADPGQLNAFDGLILPGVGAFGDAMDNIRSRGLDKALKERISSGTQLLGICLGLQLLFDYSEEHGRNEGLGVIPGRVIRLPDGVKVPHMGWNVLNMKRDVPLFEGLSDGDRFYFVHSFYCEPTGEEWTIGTTPYGLDFTCAARNNNVWGLQFHPEKSSLLGLKILDNFKNMVAEGS
jgi:imidazole glycerol-phosphate synthase subunit HisH